MTSFFRFVDKRAIYRLSIISLAHAPVHVTDFSVVNVHVDELSSARIWQHKLCATFSTNVNINYRLPIKVYYRMLSFNMGWRILLNVIRQSMLKIKTHSGFHNLFLNQPPWYNLCPHTPTHNSFLIMGIILMLCIHEFGHSRGLKVAQNARQWHSITDH
jgi:hypothetical protein